MEIKVLYDEFIRYLDAEDKQAAVSYIMDKVRNREISIINLYEEVLAPSLNNMVCSLEDRRLCIWKEHVRSSIIRTIIECCYTYVMEEKISSHVKDKKEKVVIVCPTEEYHELGARMGADYFTILGYDVIFVGCNTPEKDFLLGLAALKPEYVVVSVSNYYNLVAAKKFIDSIKKVHPSVLVIAAGHAFKEHKDNYMKVGADKFIDTFKDVVELRRDRK